MHSSPHRFLTTRLALLSGLGGLLYILGVISNGRLTHLYLFWNLFLAWIPYGLAVSVRRLSGQPTRAITIAGLLGLWLIFLPNAFYMVTDYIHVTEVFRTDPFSDTLLFSVVIFTGIALGFISLLLVHRAIIARYAARLQWHIVALIIALCSFAIYLGRVLRWNSWDIVANPLSLLHDVAALVLHPLRNIDALATCLTFFLVILIGYRIIWQVADRLRIR